MNTELIDAFYENKTWRFLSPCLRGFGEEFVLKFNLLSKLAVGLNCEDFSGTMPKDARPLFIYCDLKHNMTNSNRFLTWVRKQPYFIADYDMSSKPFYEDRIMLVINMPEAFHKAYDNFLEGRYSKMFDNEDLEYLFGTQKRAKEFRILKKDLSEVKNYVEKLNTEYNTKISIRDISDIREVELPLKFAEEVFYRNPEFKTETYIKSKILKTTDMKDSLENQLEAIQETLDIIKSDADKFENKGNKSAGTRVRTGSMSIIKALKEVRTTVLEMKNS